MSVFRAMTTELKDAKCLEKGLEKLGYNPSNTGEKQRVRGHGNEKLEADIVLKKEDTKLKGDIGFNKIHDGTYSLVYDTYVIHMDSKDFINKVSDSYAREKIRKQMLAYPNFRPKEKTLPDGTIEIVYTEVTA